MTPKRILNAYSGEAQRGSGLRYALRLAAKCDGQVFGVLRHDASYLEAEIGSFLPPSLRSSLRDIDRDRATEIANRFSQLADEEGQVGRVRFQDLRDTPRRRVADIAPFHDVVVMGHNSDALYEQHLSARADLIAVHSSRPVIIVPAGYDRPVDVTRICLVWDGRPQGVEALRHAVQIFGKVDISIRMTVDPGEEMPGGGLSELLRAHEIDPDIAPIGADRRAEVIAASLAETGADLLALGIRGPFEHSGNFEDRLVRASALPVMIAH